ncbi:serine acetyltransferase [Pokkaliibacter sp. MBI-7]|uniref:serine acetyltransferase n=1 Tax=Pokkaliibacter sp. MBI-7 TaxID=3040600 RepID=UPI0024470D0E|nr:serine acetyltransferase [Pokkaliibacter sp. MBI-7]MDH2432992.1 serine acetyltransferase [Pokkaliibacter sp. MBI-7]
MKTLIKSLVKKNPHTAMAYAYLRHTCYNTLQLRRHLYELYLSALYFRRATLKLANHLTIGITTLYEQRTVLPHPVGVVIGQGVKLGKHCTIYQNATIGLKHVSDTAYPVLGNYVTVCAHACILGDITIGDNAVIAAGAVVLHDVPANVVVAGVPARVISTRLDNETRHALIKAGVIYE